MSVSDERGGREVASPRPASDAARVAELLEAVTSEMKDVARNFGVPYSEPYTQPAVFGGGLGFVLWVNWLDADRARWLSVRANAGRSGVIHASLGIKETRGPFTLFRRELQLSSASDGETLAEAWLWLRGLLRFATELEEAEDARRAAGTGS